MSDEWDEIGFIISSEYRVTTLQRLAEGPATPSQIADEADIGIAHVSRALKGLRDRDLVELLVPEDRKKGRVYGVTSEGADIWAEIESQNLVD
jgi:DNA-binding MarR family transcriptional regulator